MSFTGRIEVWEDTGAGRRFRHEVDVEVVDGVIIVAGGGSAVHVLNKSGSDLARDQLVYVTGVTDGVLEINQADANVDDKPAMFFLPAAILDNGNGLAYGRGLSVATLNTNAAGAVDDPVYLSEGAGGWTLTAPSAAASIDQIVGRVAVKSATVGQIMWSIEAGDYDIGTNDMQLFSVTRAILATEAAKLALAVSPYDLRHTTGVPLVTAETAGGFNISVAANVVLATGEITDNETETSECNFQITLPPEYVDGGGIIVTLPANLVKTAAANDNGTTIDLEVFKQDDGAIGADICATAAQTFASVDTWFDKAFTITPTNLVAGDVLNCVVTAVVVDDEAGGGTLRLNMDAPVVSLDVKP